MLLLFLGLVGGKEYNSGIVIYKIGDYANFTLEDIYDPNNSTMLPTKISKAPNKENKIIIMIGAFLGSAIVLGIIGFFAFKKYKRSRPTKFDHVYSYN